MPRTLVTRDPNHPDFPHGTPAGARRGCPCDPCGESLRTQRRRAEKRRKMYGGVRVAPPTLVKRVHRHVASLLKAVPASTAKTICEAAGATPKVRRVILGNTNNPDDPTLSPASAMAILAVTVEQLEQHTRRGSTDEAAHLIRSMQALGYPFAWQTRQCGVHVEVIANRRKGTKVVYPRQIAAIRDLYARVGERAANPERDGVDPAWSRRATAMAAAAGFYPPACYDDNGTLDYRLVPGHPWADADDNAHNIIDTMRLITARSSDERRDRLARMVGLGSAADLPRKNKGKERAGTNPAIITAIDTIERREKRLAKRFGMRLEDPTRTRNANEWRSALIAWENSDTDAMAFCLDNNLVNPRHKSCPNDHPTVKAHLEDLAVEQGEEVAA